MSHGPFAGAMFALALASSLTVAQAGQLVVVSDSGPIGFPRGSVLNDGANVKIPSGQALELIDSGGNGVTIRGAYDGSVHSTGPDASANGSVVAALTQILTGSARHDIGIVRGAGDEPQPPDPRFVDLSGDGTFCVAPNGKAILWRPVGTKRATLFLARLSTGERAELEWPANETTIAWPDTLGIVNGETYQATFPGAMKKPRLLIKVVPFSDTSVATAARLADADCRAQALTMLQAIAAARSNP
jgi:hypothetical protein